MAQGSSNKVTPELMKQLIDRLSLATEELAAARDRVRMARREETTAVNEYNEAHKAFHEAAPKFAVEERHVS